MKTQASNLSKNIPWDLIFKLYDMQLYLSRLELNEIALTSKQIYDELKPSIFSSININNSNANRISKLIFVRKQSSNLKHFRSLRIESISQDSFTSLVDSVLNISNLTLTNQQLDLTFINSVFSKLIKLTSLKLIKVNIEVNLSHLNSNELKVPLTVRKLSISNCTSFNYTGKACGAVSGDSVALSGPSCAFYTIQNLKFHNLQQLYIKSAITHDSYLSKNAFFGSYFVNNPSLTSLSIEMSKLNDESLALILNLKSLTHLKLIGRNYNFEKILICLTNNYSLKSLHLDYTIISYHTNIILELVKYCSNIEQLTVDYSEFITPKIDRIIAGLYNLNKLTVIRTGYIQNIKLNLVNNSITHIRFTNFGLFNIEINSFGNLSRLRVVSLVSFNQISGLDKERFIRKYNEYGWIASFQGDNIFLSRFKGKLEYRSSEENCTRQAQTIWAKLTRVFK